MLSNTNFMDDYHIVVKAEDRYIIDSYHRVILWYINQQRHVPYGLVASFLNCLKDAKGVEHEELSKKADALAKVAFQKLPALKEYQFTWHPKIETSDENFAVVQYDTERVLFECIYAFLLMDQDLPTVKKEDAISFFYEAVVDEYFPRLKLSGVQKKFQPYRWMVIAGILTQTVGYRLTNKKDLNKEEIFQATRNAIRKLKSAKKQ